MYICIARLREYVKTPLTHCQRNANNEQTDSVEAYLLIYLIVQVIMVDSSML